MTARGIVTNGLMVAWALAVAAIGFVVMAAFGMAIDEPARLASRWIVHNLGPWAMAALLVGGIGALHIARKRSERADFRRQYALDKTINVERPPSRKAFLIACIPIALILILFAATASVSPP